MSRAAFESSLGKVVRRFRRELDGFSHKGKRSIRERPDGLIEVVQFQSIRAPDARVHEMMMEVLPEVFEEGDPNPPAERGFAVNLGVCIPEAAEATCYYRGGWPQESHCQARSRLIRLGASGAWAELFSVELGVEDAVAEVRAAWRAQGPAFFAYFSDRESFIEDYLAGRTVFSDGMDTRNLLVLLARANRMEEARAVIAREEQRGAKATYLEGLHDLAGQLGVPGHSRAS